VHETAQRVLGVCREPTRGEERLARAAGRLVPQRRGQTQVERDQQLTALVMDLSRHALALVLLRADDFGQERDPLAIARLQFFVQPRQFRRARLDALLERPVRGRNLLQRILQRASHALERRGQAADFVVR
jgi:hypothetical protein